jgi:hypothetical protein
LEIPGSLARVKLDWDSWLSGEEQTSAFG